jgi:hypothetical protein
VKSQRLLLNPSSQIIKLGQQLVVLATTRAQAEAGAAGDGVEATNQFAEAVRQAAVAATPAVPLDQGRQQLPTLKEQQQQQQQPLTPARVGVTVRVPSLLADELQAAGAAADATQARAGSDWRQQQQQQQQQARWQQLQQELLGYQQQQQKQQVPFPQQPSSSTVPVINTSSDSSRASTSSHGGHGVNGGSSSDSDSNSSSSTNSVELTVPGKTPVRAAAQGPLGVLGSSYNEDDDAEDAVDLDSLNPCLANWTGAFESDSMDETEVCSESQLLEAALLQRQRQQQREQRRAQRQQQLDQVQQQQLMASLGGSGCLMNARQQQQQPMEKLATGSSSSSSNGHHPTAAQTDGAFATDDISNGSSASSMLLSQQGHQQQQQQQQQQQPAPSGPRAAPDPRLLTGHFIITGCMTGFVPFAQQLHAMAPPEAAPVTVVLLHSEFSPDVFNQVSLLGPAFFVQGKPADPAALAAAGAQTARSLVYLGPSERPTHVSAQSVSGVYGDPTLHPNDYNSTSRTAVLADAEALSCCYGVLLRVWGGVGGRGKNDTVWGGVGGRGKNDTVWVPEGGWLAGFIQ